MRDYVTGVTGFIGSHLARRLKKPVYVPHSEKLDLSVWNGKIGRVFFLSSYGNLAHQTNVREIVLRNSLEPIALACLWHVPFVFFSTSSVNRPVQTLYSQCKLATERVLLALPKDRTMIVIRPYTVTGVGDHACHLIPTLIRSCRTGESMPFFPDAAHDYIDVEDLLDGVIRVVRNGESGIFEFGNGISVSNSEVRHIVETATGQQANTHEGFTGRPYDSPDWRCLNDAGSVNCRKSLEQTVKEMVDDYDLTSKKMR